MTRIDMRSGAWRKMREARKRLAVLMNRACAASNKAHMAEDHVEASWQFGRADGLAEAMVLLKDIEVCARKGKRKR